MKVAIKMSYIIWNGGFCMESYETEKEQGYQNSARQETASEMTVGNWLITMLILFIPIVNIVMLFIWGFGNPDQRRNFARAYLIWMAISIVLGVIFYGALMALILSFSSY